MKMCKARSTGSSPDLAAEKLCSVMLLFRSKGLFTVMPLLSLSLAPPASWKCKENTSEGSLSTLEERQPESMFLKVISLLL